MVLCGMQRGISERGIAGRAIVVAQVWQAISRHCGALPRMRMKKPKRKKLPRRVPKLERWTKAEARELSKLAQNFLEEKTKARA
jgi:hypothetical protein